MRAKSASRGERRGLDTEMRVRGWVAGCVGLLMVSICVWQILTVSRGLEVTRFRTASPPFTLVEPKAPERGSRPLVLVAHGIAGSEVIMRGFGYTLAYAGYTVALWDFGGHGANARPFSSGGASSALLEDAEAVLAQATAQSRQSGDARDQQAFAILGHSMGSGLALLFGQEHPETAATIAVSPTGQQVTTELPHNLLLMAGSLEGRFVGNAQNRLSEAGGEGGDPTVGSARRLVVIPGVEHISILFSPTAHAVARDWLDSTFGPQPGAVTYVDRRIRWYGLGLLGALVAAFSFAPLIGGSGTIPTPRSVRPLVWRLASLLGGGILSTLSLWLASHVGLEPHSFLGLIVGGYLLVWFALAGLASLLILWQRPLLPKPRALWAGLAAFLALWLGVGLLGQLVWLPWLLIPQRLMLWPLGVALTLPWFLAAGQVLEGSSAVGRTGWWLACSATVAGCTFVAFLLSPELGFLILILPVFPAILGFHAVVAGAYRPRWAFALSGSLFTSWLVLAVFPLL